MLDKDLSGTIDFTIMIAQMIYQNLNSTLVER